MLIHYIYIICIFVAMNRRRPVEGHEDNGRVLSGSHPQPLFNQITSKTSK